MKKSARLAPVIALQRECPASIGVNRPVKWQAEPYPKCKPPAPRQRFEGSRPRTALDEAHGINTERRRRFGRLLVEDNQLL